MAYLASTDVAIALLVRQGLLNDIRALAREWAAMPHGREVAFTEVGCQILAILDQSDKDVLDGMTPPQ